MEFDKAIRKRRSFRALDKVEITDEIIEELANAAKLAPSCFNKQPWEYVFVRSPKMLEKMHDAISDGNEWTYDASLIIAVCSKPDKDCIVAGNEYFKFDIGMSVGIMMLKATDMGLVAHAIAGYSRSKTKKILNIPDDYQVITLINVGKHGDYKEKDNLSEKQIEAEKNRPPRKNNKDFAFIDKYGK